MTNTTSYRALLIILALVLTPGWLCAQSKVADPCDVSTLPQEIQTKLAKDYPDWQPEKLENLYEDDRQFWTKAHPNDCPGIAIGHFESKIEISYALLLISKPDRKRLGYRLVVFSRSGPSAPYVPHLVSKWNIGLFYEGSDQVVETVPAGHYEEAIGPHKVSIDLDGIGLEAIDKGAILYYWKNGRYHELITSE
jgi:hypothetical protein